MKQKLTTYKENTMSNPEDFRSFHINATTKELGPQRYECTPENTSLYLHRPGVKDEYDHIFRTLSQEELPEEIRGTARNLGGFIWREVLGDEEFQTIGQRICASYNFNVVFRPEPLESDQIQYFEFAQAKLSQELDGMDWDDFSK
jgi:hypothetical protein